MLILLVLVMIIKNMFIMHRQDARGVLPLDTATR